MMAMMQMTKIDIAEAEGRLEKALPSIPPSPSTLVPPIGGTREFTKVRSASSTGSLAPRRDEVIFGVTGLSRITVLLFP